MSPYALSGEDPGTRASYDKRSLTS